MLRVLIGTGLVLMAVLLFGRSVLLWSPRRCSGVVVLAVTGWYVLVVLSMAVLGKGAHG